jgi:hypothetical protein
MVINLDLDLFVLFLECLFPSFVVLTFLLVTMETLVPPMLSMVLVLPELVLIQTKTAMMEMSVLTTPVIKQPELVPTNLKFVMMVFLVLLILAMLRKDVFTLYKAVAIMMLVPLMSVILIRVVLIIPFLAMMVMNVPLKSVTLKLVV